MAIQPVPFFKPAIDKQAVFSLLSQAIDNGWYTSGPLVKQFEDWLEQYLGRPAIALNSGTSALTLALKLAGVGPGDEVILPANTFIATLEVVQHLHARPVLCDIDPDTLNIDINQIEQLITGKTRAIIAVAFAGLAADMQQLNLLCENYGLALIADNAHALETKYNDQPLAQWAHFSAYSFYATKNLTTAEGGALTVNNSDEKDRARLLALHGMSKNAWGRYQNRGSFQYDILETGYKMNLPDILAAFALTQTENLEKNLERRHQILGHYHQHFKNNPGIWQPDSHLSEECAAHLAVFRLNGGHKAREILIEVLHEHNIGSSVHFIPLYHFTMVKNKLSPEIKNFSNNEKYFDGAISLPLYPSLSDTEVDFIINTVNKAVF